MAVLNLSCGCFYSVAFAVSVLVWLSFIFFSSLFTLLLCPKNLLLRMFLVTTIAVVIWNLVNYIAYFSSIYRVFLFRVELVDRPWLPDGDRDVGVVFGLYLGEGWSVWNWSVGPFFICVISGCFALCRWFISLVKLVVWLLGIVSVRRSWSALMTSGESWSG